MCVHLHVHTPYSFLDGGSDIDALVRSAASHGSPALALTDHDNVCAVVKFVASCEAYGIKPLLGAEVTLSDNTHLTLIARNRRGYADICRMLTAAHESGGRLNPRLPWDVLYDLASDAIYCLSGCRKGRISSLVREHRYAEAREIAERLQARFGSEAFFIELQDDLTPDAHRACADLAGIGRDIGAGIVATNNVHHAARGDFIAHDILRCIAAKTTLDQSHPMRPLNAERYLKSPDEMASLFAAYPEALANTFRIADDCEACLPRQEEITPSYRPPEGHTAESYLRHLTFKGAKARYRELHPNIVERIEHELSVINELGYADYFLMVWDIVRWTRRQGIRCTGRGSAADSCVAYCLYLTDVDVIARSLPFARFLTPGRTPDIDMDFPSERRDDIFRHIIEKHGPEHVGMVCTFFTFWARSAVRDIGKALALPEDAIGFLAKRLHHSIRADRIEAAFERYAELKPHHHLIDRFRTLFDLCGRISGFPRHIGTHSSGIVISAASLASIAPIQPSARGITNIWTLDKDDAETVGAIKFDVLSLRALSAVGDAERDLAVREPSFRYDRLPNDDAETYRMIRAGAAVGAFQFESAAQLALAVILEPQHFEDLVASVALIRPGPIRGDVVRRFVGCRNGWARADWAHPCLKPVLAKTYGCIVFQEQVNDVVAVMTGCSDVEADRFRKSLKRYDKLNTMDDARQWFVERALCRHPEMSPERVNRLFDQIEGWSGYGFIEGHAAAFALTGYRTAYLAAHHPAEHFAGFMNHQPMGFYSANTLAGEARRRGVQVLPVDINRSGDKCTTPDASTIQLGLRLVSGTSQADIEAITRAGSERPFRSLLDFCARVSVPHDLIEDLVLCGAFDSLHEHRRGLLWRLDETLAMARSYRSASGSQQALSIGDASTLATPIAWDIDDFTPWDKFIWTWRVTGVCAECHAMAYMRNLLDSRGVLRVSEAMSLKPGALVRVAGLNVCPHRPPTRSGEPVLFSQIEDETGLLPVTVAGGAILSCTASFLTSPAVLAEGRIQRRGRGASLSVERVTSLALRDTTAFVTWDRRNPDRDFGPPLEARPSKEEQRTASSESPVAAPGPAQALAATGVRRRG